ncbi:DUF3987 domain-containing protein [Marinobacter sp. NSM]|uniref:DUF3987 domain-containing protein n=1 Tax=Marinobacter sp. NSM TaxID=3458004 RepID=UPI0040375534
MEHQKETLAAGQTHEGAYQNQQGNYSIIGQKPAIDLLARFPCCFLKSPPANTKEPKGTNWPSNPRKPDEWKSGTGLGVICGLSNDDGLSVQAVDVDTPHIEMAADLLAFIRPLLEKRTGHKLVRIGKRPKFLIPYKTREPQKKQASAELFPINADGEIDTRREVKNQIEILGTGQQFVAYQIHPETGQPYLWESLTGEEPQTLHDTELADLVELTKDDIESILWAFDELAERHGLQTKKPKQINQTKVGPVDRQSVADLLRWIPNNDDGYDSWFNVLASIKHESGEAGREDAYQWSCQSSKHDDGKFQRTWESIKRADGRTIGTLIWLALQNGMPKTSQHTALEQAQAQNPPEPTQWSSAADLFSEHVVPAFPMDILPEAFRALADEKSEQSGFDSGAYGFCLLVSAANTIDHRAKLDLGPFSVPAYLWGGLVGDSGTAKSPILNDAKRSAEHIDKALLDESRRALSRWMDACQRAKEDKAEMPPKPPWKQRHATDTTTEALGLLLQDNPEGVNMYHHEITEFIGRMDAYSGKDGGKDRGVYLRSYDGGYVTINRAGRAQPLVIDNFSVGILAGIQPEKLAYLFKKSGGGSDGLYQRFMMYCLQPAGEVNYMAKESPFTQSNVDMIVERIHNWTGQTKVSARLSDSAKLMMQDYHNNIRKLATRTSAQRFGEHLNKFPGTLGRVAFALHCIHAAAEDKDPAGVVTAETMAMAIRFMRVMYRHSEAVYRILDQEAGDVRALVVAAAEAILSKSWDTFKRGDLTRNATYWQGADNRQSENAIDYLIELGWIADITPPAMPGRRGRRSDGVYAVNPSVHAQYQEHRERIKSARAERYQAIREAAG